MHPSFTAAASQPAVAEGEFEAAAGRGQAATKLDARRVQASSAISLSVVMLAARDVGHLALIPVGSPAVGIVEMKDDAHQHLEEHKWAPRTRRDHGSLHLSRGRRRASVLRG